VNAKRYSIIAFVFLILALAGLIIRKSLFAGAWIAIIVQIGAVCLMIWGRLTFGSRSFHAAANPTEGGLVTKGPYRFIRHPIYAAVIYFIWAGVLSHISLINICLAIVITAAFAIRIRSEERLLVGMYPEYAAYSARTKRIVPFII
jgi:protein-S-isoprenylcysteine O-methyltransferase Ste14